MPLDRFIETIAPATYNEYVIDRALDKRQSKRLPEKQMGLDALMSSKPKFTRKESPLHKIKKLSSLKPDHPAMQYVKSRGIPTDKHYMLYYAPKFKTWTNSVVPDTFKEFKKDEPRLVLPMIDEHDNLYGFVGRSFDPKSDLKYIIILIDKTYPKIFGLNSVDMKKRYFVVEGQIDSLFLDNAVAMAGSDGTTRGLRHTENAVFVFDNEPRNKAIAAKMAKVIDAGHKIVILSHKHLDMDINDMILSGVTSQDIVKMLDAHTYDGLDAKLALTMWKR